jgi:hypothetical protein
MEGTTPKGILRSLRPIEGLDWRIHRRLPMILINGILRLDSQNGLTCIKTRVVSSAP